MKKILREGIALLFAAMVVLAFTGCPTPDAKGEKSSEPLVPAIKVTINDDSGNSGSGTINDLGEYGERPETVKKPGSYSRTVPQGSELKITVSAASDSVSGVNFKYASGTADKPDEFGDTAEVYDGTYLWVEVKSKGITQYYKIRVTVKTQGAVETDGFGVPDPEFKAKYPYFVFPNLAENEILTEEKLPAPSYWNSINVENGLQGHMHAYPDPFHFANGNRVTNLKDWENRRKEMRLLVSYYMKGRLPSLDPDVVTITLSGTNNRTITVKHNVSNRTTTVTVSVTPNATAQTEENWGKLGLGTAVGNDGMGLGGSYSGGSRANIATLYGIDQNLVSRDSAAGWAASVVLIAIEGVNDDGDGEKFLEPVPDGSMSWFTPQGPLSASGISTNGKLAMYTAALAHGRKPGTRFGYADIGDSGAGGAAIERFVSTAGFRLDVTIQQALEYSGYTVGDMTGKLGFSSADLSLKNPVAGYGWPVDHAPIGYVGARTRELGLGGFDDLKGMPYYLTGIRAGDSMRDPSMGTYGTATADLMDNPRSRTVRGWSPYLEAFEAVPNADSAFGSTFGTGTAGTDTKYKAPYVAWQADGWGGIQNMNQIKGEDATGYNWHGETFKSFNDIHDGLDLDHARTATGTRGKEGFVCNVPFDVYFATMLQAPYGANCISAGVYQTRTNQPSMWANWLLVDEVYKMYGELEYAEEHGGELVDDPAYPGSGLKMGWDKYIWNNVSYFTWATHTVLSNLSNTLTAHRGRVLRGTATTDAAKADAKLSKLRDPFFHVDDPVLFLGDFHKMDWGRPGSSTIAQRVARRVEPILKDYFLGEQYHDVPGANTNDAAAAYHENAKTKYTPTGPKFKPMDWRGLTEQPENQ